MIACNSAIVKYCQRKEKYTGLKTITLRVKLFIMVMGKRTQTVYCMHAVLVTTFFGECNSFKSDYDGLCTGYLAY